MGGRRPHHPQALAAGRKELAASPPMLCKEIKKGVIKEAASLEAKALVGIVEAAQVKVKERAANC